MRLEEVEELHYITPIANLPSIVVRGILSHRLIGRLTHQSVAMPEVQAIRASVTVPRGRPLHDYANLYFNARNPMLYKRLDRHRELCVVSVPVDVLTLADVVITDQNAASRYRRWGSFPEGLRMIDSEHLFSEWWSRHDDERERERHTSQMCAEALIPDKVRPEFLVGAYVSCDQASAATQLAAPGLPVSVNRYLFFQEPKR